MVHTYRNDEKLWDSVVETRKSFFANLGMITKMKDVCDMNSGLTNKKQQQILTLKLLKTLGITDVSLTDNIGKETYETATRIFFYLNLCPADYYEWVRYLKTPTKLHTLIKI